MRETGFNTVHLIIEYVVWKEEHDGFMERFERYIALCHEHGMSAMIVLANDCMPPKTELWKMPYVGEQQYDIGYHGGKKHSQHGSHSGPAPHFYLDDDETRDNYFEMIREIVSKYKDDEHICIWDVYNESGNSRRRDITLPNLKAIFSIVREIAPFQPLTCGVWNISGDPNTALDEPQQPQTSEIEENFEPWKPKVRKSGTGCVYQINDHLWEGSYFPRLPDGSRKKFNVYAKTREECEKLLAEMIEKKKAEIAEMKKKAKAV